MTRSADASQSPKAAAGHMALLSEVFRPHGYLGTGYLTRNTANDLVETETAKRGNGNHRQQEDEQEAAGTRAQPGATAVSLCRRAPTVKPAGPGGRKRREIWEEVLSTLDDICCQKKTGPGQVTPKANCESARGTQSYTARRDQQKGI